MGIVQQQDLPLDIPKGQVGTIITHLEMLERPEFQDTVSPLSLESWINPAVADYLQLFRAVGEPWLWTSRLLMAKAEVQAILDCPDTEICLVTENRIPVGFIELDFRISGQCEIAFFGLTAEMNGRGHGRWMMNQALLKAWRDSVERVWLHTCTQDSPRALPFYQRCGFCICRQQLDIMPDPRLSGHLPESAAPHVPILR